MTDEVRAALRAAVREIAAHDPRCPWSAEACRTMDLGPDWLDTVPAKQASAAIAAFLRRAHVPSGVIHTRDGECYVGDALRLAAAVEEAARHE